MPSACPAPLAEPEAATGLAQQSSWLYLGLCPGKACAPSSHRPLCGSRVLAPWPWVAVAASHPDPLPGDAAVMDSVSPDMSHAISSETIPVATAQQTPSSTKDYWLKQCDVRSSFALLTEVKSARSIEFRQLPPKPAHSFIYSLFGSPGDAIWGSPVRVGEMTGLHAVSQVLVDVQCKTSYLATRPHLTG